MYDGVFEVLQWLLFLSAVPPVQLLTGWCVTAKALPDISAISALTAVKHGNCSSLTPLLKPGTHQKIIDMAMNGVGCRATARIMGVGLNTIFRHLKKLRPQSVTSRIQPGSDVIVCAEMDEQWGYVGAKSRQRWLFYAYDRLRKTVVAHVFGERTMATLGRLMSLLSSFDV
ncbi:IS1 transposase [Escherichia coli]|uniref:IS1 transposase n=1 Tax=Escherichia coli TaxID=562 RepID=A0A377CIU9_ECOLX|nr:IS1 transposase [Escherichia coli]